MAKAPVLTAFACAVGLTVSGPRAESAGGQENMLSPAERAAGWQLLFDGQSLSGWTPRGDAVWRVDDGALTAGPGSLRGFLLTTREFADFDLQIDFWIGHEANSGVFLRCPAADPIDQKTAVEVNIFDPHRSWPTGSINEVARVQTVPDTVGRWNRYDITADGARFIVNLNGETTVDAHDDRHERGPIGLQHCCNSRSEVKFRNIKIRPRER